MADERTYRIQGANAPRLLFELSRLGRRLERPGGRDADSGIGTAPPQVDERERYEADGAIVSVDHLEQVGWLCAIRAEDAAAIDALAAKLGLSAAAIEPRGYAELVGTPPPARESTPAPGRLGTRDARLLLIALIGLAVAVASGPLMGAIAVLALLVLEWGFGGGRPSG